MRRLLAVLFAALAAVPAASGLPIALPGAPSAAAAVGGSCVPRENPYEIADQFISRCRKASIRREFPSEYLSHNLAAIEREHTANGRKAWKLLNDSRFAR